MYDLTYFYVFLIFFIFYYYFCCYFLYNVYITFDIYNFLLLKLYYFICVLYHSYLSFFSLPLVCDAFLSHLLLSNVTAYIHGNVNAFLSSTCYYCLYVHCIVVVPHLCH